MAVAADNSSWPIVAYRFDDNADCSSTGVFPWNVSLPAARQGWGSFTHVVTAGASSRALYLQLSVFKRRSADVTVLWDDVEIEHAVSNPLCGNCVIDEGESCDDGNRLSGDGCGATCLGDDSCGNAIREDGEECDDGNRAFGEGTDTCTPACRTKTECDACAASSCAARLDPCLGLAGSATAGPDQGAPRAALCDELRACVHQSGCAGESAISGTQSPAGSGRYLEHCYCGNSGTACFEGGANGSCRAEVEAALETTDPIEILGRVGGADPAYPIFAALDELLLCELESCSGMCTTEFECGNGIVQDRSLEFAESYRFVIGRMSMPCRDELTHTGTGCSFEECDDGNVEGGDGCDANCFVEECGNNLRQGDEECDDGNRTSGDGCDAQCGAEFQCNDGTITEPFEECDPPMSGTVCSVAQYESNPAQCGCDASCLRQVCGNGILQEGEQCDPPGPVCTPTCQHSIDVCTECIRQVRDPLGYCEGDAFLNGDPEYGPGFEVGCMNDEACFNLWNCYRSTQCVYRAGTYFHACYCGTLPNGSAVDENECRMATYEPTGACVDETLAAFEAQWRQPPTDNAEVLQLFNDYQMGPGARMPSYAIATYLAMGCLQGPDSTRGILEASGVTDPPVAECISACYP
jgi:cysteine-rich repeat protein